MNGVTHRHNVYDSVHDDWMIHPDDQAGWFWVLFLSYSYTKIQNQNLPTANGRNTI